MKKILSTNNYFKVFMVLLMMCFLVTCDDTDSDSTSSGTLSNLVTNATLISATITDVSIPHEDSTGGVPTIEFTVVDQNGDGVSDLTSARFIIAKLVAAANGESSYWQSYINQTETVEEGDDGTQAVGTTAVQATTESWSSTSETNVGTFTELGNGEYRYVFGTDLSDVSTASGAVLDVAYEPTLTHRVAIQISGTGANDETIVANPTYDFIPSTGATSGFTTTREMAVTTSCNECHGTLAMHGGGRTEMKYCVTCHNPGTTDAHSGETMDMKVLIHKVHRGAELPSVSNGGESYIIWGYHNSENDYSTVVFPQNISHCDKCHDPADTETTPDAVNYVTVPTEEACGSCHDNIVFDGSTPADWQTAHSGGTTTNADCTTCHGGSEATVDGRIAGVHSVLAEVNAAYFQFNILSISNTGPGEFPVVTFSVTDPINGTTYDIDNDAEFTTGGGVATLTVLIAWSAEDYSNEGSGSKVAQPVSINALTLGVANGDLTNTVTSTVAIPADATGSGAVALQGHPASLDADGAYTLRTPVTSAVSYFSITDSEATERRTVVDNSKCNNCHYQLNLHGSNRNNSVEVCLLCHNPNATDLSKRPAAANSYADLTLTGADGLVERSIDFKWMIHAIHAGDADEEGFREEGVAIYGYGSSVNDYSEVRFPGDLKDCLQCHDTDTYIFPLDEDVLGTTMSVGDVTADVTGPDEDENNSPATAVCSSCHDSDTSVAHMTLNGGLTASTQATIDDNTETCSVCHGDGDSADVKTVHSITE